MTFESYLPNAGDLIWTDFDPPTGREQAGRKPAVIVSPAAFALNTGFVIVCPITTRIRPFPTSVVLPESVSIKGEILLSHLRAIDMRAGPIHSAGTSLPAERQLVRAKLGAIITI